MQLSDEVIKILEYLGSKIGLTIDWTGENILPYITQLAEKFIKWEVGTSTAWIIIACAITVLFLVIAICIHIWGDWYGTEWILFGFVFCFAMIICGVQIFDIIECKAFPEKAIYDYIQLQLRNS